MKIALYVPSWPPGNVPNGIVTYASQIVPALRNLGHEVFIITPNKSDADPRTVDLRKFAHSSSIWDRAAAKIVPDAMVWRAMTSSLISALRYLILTYGLEVFEIEESFGWNLAISRLRLVPVVVRLHGPWFLNGAFDDHKHGIHSRLRRQAWEGSGIRNCQFITAPSMEVLQAVRSHYRFTLAKSRVIPNPLDSAAEECKWDREYCDPKRILFVGRFDRRKGGDVVLRVFAELASIYPNLTLTFVGPDIGIKGPDKKTLSFERFTHENLPEWCRSRIQFRGQMPHSELMSLRRKCFLTIVASQYEIMPYSVLEAMSLGCPIVATNVGGIPEMIQDRHNGLLVPSQDPSKMSAACKALLDDPAFAASLGDQSWNDCRELYGPATIAQQTSEAYCDAIRAFESNSSR